MKLYGTRACARKGAMLGHVVWGRAVALRGSIASMHADYPVQLDLMKKCTALL
jgi:hypothetical protein